LESVPNYSEIKCDYRSCNAMATKYFEKVALQVMGEGVMARNTKVCDHHKDKMIKRLEMPRDTSKSIPYVANGHLGLIQCGKCSHRWIPETCRFNRVDTQHYMKMPFVCPCCKIWGYRNYKAKRGTLKKCLIA
jgi:hypothetical protein